MRRLLETRPDVALTIVRIAAGAVMLPHGLQKALGWFGGNGFAPTMQFFTEVKGIPAPLALLAIIAETLGALGLIFGFLSRISAFGVGVTILVAMFTVQLPNGFFMNWMGNQKGEGIEYSLLMASLTAVTVLRGGGAYSLDRLLLRLKRPAVAPKPVTA